MLPIITKLAGPFCLMAIGCAAFCYSRAYSDEPAAANEASQAKTALAPLQGLVGAWNGTGQPRRGSNVGAWSEQSAWAWHFDTRSKDGKALSTAELRASFKDGKYFSQLVIEPTAKAKRFRLVGTLPDGKTAEQFDAALDDAGILTATRVLEKEAPAKQAVAPGSDSPGVGVPGSASDSKGTTGSTSAIKGATGSASDGRPARITIKQVANGERMVVLYERAAGEGYARLAEVGATRVGGMFAVGVAGPECIVTGGRGTIAVTHAGQTYYVCCSGCKEAFDADPAGIVAEYLAKKKAK